MILSEEEKNRIENIEIPKSIRNLETRGLELQNFSQQLLNDRAKEYCVHGVLRRVFTLLHCLKRISIITPPNRTEHISFDEKGDITAYLHCFIINLYGAINNLALILYHEKLSDKEKKKIPERDVYFSSIEIQKYFSAGLKKRYEDFNEWVKFFNEQRHPIAHRIPIYLIPYFFQNVEEKNKEKQLKEKFYRSSNVEERRKILEEMDTLGVYAPAFTGSLYDGKTKIVPLWQILADANTLDDLIKVFIDSFEHGNSYPGKYESNIPKVEF